MVDWPFKKGLALRPDIMADGSRCRVVTSAGTEMTTLGRALSQVCFNHDLHSQACTTDRSNAPQECRRRRLSSSGSVVSLERCPDAEVRVMVINTGGTIGMTYQNNGNRTPVRTFTAFFVCVLLMSSLLETCQKIL